MAGSVFVDVCRFNPTLGGTTDWTFSSAVNGYQSPASAGIVNSSQYSYRAESSDLTQWEIGSGTYNTGTGVLARTTVLYNSSATGTGAGQSGAGTKINFSTVPQVAIVALREDLLTANITKAIQQTGTDNVAGVTSLHQQDHDSAAKAWVVFTCSTAAILASYNVSGVVRNSAGLYTISFTTAFASASYAVVATPEGTGSLAADLVIVANGGRAAGSVQMNTFNSSTGSSGDATTLSVTCFGRQ